MASAEAFGDVVLGVHDADESTFVNQVEGEGMVSAEPLDYEEVLLGYVFVSDICLLLHRGHTQVIAHICVIDMYTGLCYMCYTLLLCYSI